MRMRILLFCLFFATNSACSQRSAGIEPIDILRVKVGDKFPLDAVFPPRKEMATGFGFYTFQAPNKTDGRTPFQSYEVAIFEDDRTVYYVKGTRPYVSRQSCNSEFDSLVMAIKGAPDIRVSFADDSRLQAQGIDSEIDVSCSTQAGSPFVDLQLLVRSSSIYEKMRKRAR